MHGLDDAQSVQVGTLRNYFALHESSSHKTLIASCIRATPIFAMARQLQNTRADFRAIHLVRSKDFAALHEAFVSLNLGDRYRLHCDDTIDPINLVEVMRSVPLNGDICRCGPEPLLNAILKVGKSLREGTTRFERFVASSEAKHNANTAFEVEIEPTKAVYHVSPEDSTLNVLKHNGLQLDVGCAEVFVDVVKGEVDHRDGLLTPDEQASNELMCVSVTKSKSNRLTLRL
ncbi:flavin reductase family protein [Pseudovibrio ascidiaceicola]|uniref:flavin reductase family protein n=1 Tax=Pseudovibrio ascidiaceicola TaxID=285279 RepID=UPI003D3625BF